jgi:adenylosuccinate lyase
VGEVAEPFGKGQKGSSAMPHKRNPIVAERICGLARVVRANAQVGLENVPLWHERDISHSSAERVVIPDSFLALDYMLDRFAWLMEGLVVRSERMRRNLDAARGLFFSQRLLLALVESGLARNEAYRLVQRHALRAHEEEQDFRELVRRDDEITARVDLDSIFDLDWYTRHADTVFERLEALARKEEPIHA